MPSEPSALGGRGDIAIIGLGCRLPGARTPSEYWDLLCAGADAVGTIPADRSYYRLPGAAGRLITDRGGFIERIEDFDPYFFGISPRDAVGLDPQHRLLMETAWRAAEDAGVTAAELQRCRTGVFVGLSSTEYLTRLTKEMPDAEFQQFFSSVPAHGSGRLSNVLRLTGPSLTVDTACSSALVCVHLAVRSLQAGDCDLAFAGGANALLDPATTRAFTRGGVLSPDGTCHAFSERANGFVRSEGAGMALLKPLARALEDGDRIYAVILGSAVNNDGGKASFFTPSREGQVAVIRAACADSGVSPGDIVYVEAHGTGTPTGDPVEVAALAEALGDGRPADAPLHIGSCKTNVGHLESAAGIAGLMKAALSLYHRAIPPSRYAEDPSTAIPWNDLPVRVQSTLTSWPEHRRLLAGVNSFGIYGTNAHVLLAGAPAAPTRAPVSRPPRAHVLPLSARDEVSLQELAREWQRHLRHSTASLEDLCHTAAHRRTHFDHRLVVSGRTREELIAALEAWLARESRPGTTSGRVTAVTDRAPVFVFSGVGSHWPAMGLELYDRYPVFRESFDRAAAALAPHVDWNPLDQLRREAAGSRLDFPEVGQPLIFAVQIALADLWSSWGVRPGAAIGHSLGEHAASVAAGALSLEDAALVVCARSDLMAKCTRGGMLACGIPPAEGEALIRGLEDRVSVGVISGSRSIVLSGDVSALDEIARTLEATGAFCRRVRTQAPTHSPLMDPILDDLRRRIAGIRPRPSRIPMWSTVTGAVIDGESLTPDYWVRNVRDRVLFAPAMERLLEQGEHVFVEVSPHPLLIAPIRETAAERSCSVVVVPSIRRGQDSEISLLESFGRLHVEGCAVQWSAHTTPGAGHADVPGHPFRRERIWLAQEGGGRHAEQAFARVARPGAHPLLPLRFQLADKPDVHVWEGTLDPADHPFLTEHLTQGEAVMPAALYYELAYAIATEMFGPGPKSFADIQLRRALFIRGGRPVRLQAVLARAQVGTFALSFYGATSAGDSTSDGDLCCRMTLREAPAVPGRAPVIADADGWPGRVTRSEFYERAKEFGLEYGPLFQGIDRVRRRGFEVVADLDLPAALRRERGFLLHPAILDMALQLPLAAHPRPVPLMPIAVRAVELSRPIDPHERLRVWCRWHADGRSDIALIGEDGTVLLRVDKHTVRELSAPVRLESSSLETSGLYHKRWEPLPDAVLAADPGRWLIAGDAADAIVLGVELERRGQAWDSCVGHDGFEDMVTAGNVPWRGIVYLACRATAAHPERELLDRPAGESSGADQPEPVRRLFAFIQEASRRMGSAPPRLFVVTRGAHAVTSGDPVDLRAAPLVGLARAAANELPRFRLTTIDLDPRAGGFASLVGELLADSLETDVAYRGGVRYGGRLGRLALAPLRRRRKRVRIDAQSDRSYAVVSPNPGSPDAVALEADTRRAPEPDEIEIRVAAAGLNFLDVLRSLGMGPAQRPGPATFGMELSGRVARMGAGVTAFAVGDRVMSLTTQDSGTFRAWATVPARYAWRVPAGLTDEEAATCLVAYQTAWYALVELGRMRAGDRVLIHAAAGGVGLAAVHVAQHVGAEIFATAGSDEKREYLRRLGVPHVMDSRTLEFADQVLAATEGRGVDLVLNSIAGEAIARSISTLAPGGRFLEIGKRDIYANSTIELFPFRRNLSYFAIDMIGLMEEREADVLRATADVCDRLASGALPPLPVKAFPANDAADAFRYMVQSRQIGKVAVTFLDDDVEAEIPNDRLIREDATYLITGGLSGIGFECARWLVARGARHVVLGGRRTPSPSEQQRIQELCETGAQVVPILMDVARRADVRRALDVIDREMPPLAGVIHSAGVIRDGIIERLQWSQFEEVFAPKVQGGWNLQMELGDRDLDFLVLFSSVASLLGSAGQANYAAANAFLDGLAGYRRSRGLPVLTINWGPWTGLGMLERHSLQSPLIFGEHGIRAEQGIAALEALLARDVAHATVMSADWKVWRQAAPLLATSPLLSDFRREMDDSSAGASAAGLVGELAGVSEAEAIQRISGRLAQEVEAVLHIPEDRLDVQTGLNRLGLDSLMAIELSHRIQAALGVDMPVMSLLSGSSIADLAATAYRKLAPEIQAVMSDASPAAAEPPAVLSVPARAETTRQTEGRPGSWVIARGNRRQALFCLGGLSPWPSVALQLGNDTPVIGVVPPDVKAAGRPTIEDFAAAAVQVIREHQPNGPYHLAGWSAWGIVAFEVAQQLRAADAEVQSLTIVDSYFPFASRKMSVAGVLTAWLRMERRRLAYHLRKLRDPEARTLAYLRERIQSYIQFRLKPIASAVVVRARGTIRGAQDYSAALVSASAMYYAKPYSGKVVLCMAADTHDGDVAENIRLWKSVIRDECHVLVLPGDHASLFHPENVGPLVEMLRQMLEPEPLPAPVAEVSV